MTIFIVKKWVICVEKMPMSRLHLKLKLSWNKRHLHHRPKRTIYPRATLKLLRQARQTPLQNFLARRKQIRSLLLRRRRLSRTRRSQQSKKSQVYLTNLSSACPSTRSTYSLTFKQFNELTRPAVIQISSLLKPCGKS